ncbi:hypothetical protein MIB92_15235 [Aestuariirhabdus sp. Z084]|uniref:hypothetical protein n=1 Tax=Aestuariirhabdus haliotis TaxID=2918751 RepID=UPI00201B420F|nr:hypothetical protein [Aestuariirhabdus haliotis]MCL6417013.1 hypothetical protein [Aestuariirhabdus haliotis]MCL6421046.1 hypothetical protein [Aestuariirhabdus haliotis]
MWCQKIIINIWGVFLFLLPLEWAIGTVENDTSDGYRIAIIDRFYPPQLGFGSPQERSSSNWLYGLYDLDNDDEREPLYHGDLVQRIASHPHFTFFHFPMASNMHPMAEISRNLHNLLAQLDKRPIDALLLSWESSTLVSAFENPLKPANAERYIQTVRQWGIEHTSWKNTYRIIRQLESLGRRGVKVFTIAGNGGPGMVNTFSFATGVTTVGASERELQHFVANNPFVDTFENAAYVITRIDDHTGKAVGYDINGDRCSDITLKQLSGRGKHPASLVHHYWKPLIGSSFAAPMALRKALIPAEARKPCDG